MSTSRKTTVKNKIPSYFQAYLDLWVSLEETEKFVDEMVSNPVLLADTIKTAFNFDIPHVWRAWWYIDRAGEKNPLIMEPHIPEIARCLPNLPNSSIKRHFTRILSRHNIPVKYMGTVVNYCFEWLSANEPVAVKANSMQVLFNIAKLEPGLSRELIVVIESQYENGSTGFKNKAQKILSVLRERENML